MNTTFSRQFKIAALLSVLLACTAAAVFNKASVAKQDVAAVEQIPTITITAKRLSASEKAAWAKQDSDAAHVVVTDSATAPAKETKI